LEFLRKLSVFCFSCCVFLIEGVFSVQAQNYIVPYQKGSIDWSNGILESFGKGVASKGLHPAQDRSVAKNQAIADAKKAMLSLIEQLPISAGYPVKDHIAAVDSAREGLRDVIQRAHLAELKYGPEGTVIATMSLKLFGTLSEHLLPLSVKIIPTITQQPSSNNRNGSYTGLIVECRGLRVFPVLLPRIVDEDGSEVYGPAYVSRENAVRLGVAGWMSDLASAKNDWRSGEKPFVIRAIGPAGPAEVRDIRISNADAEKIRSQASNLELMHHCRVIFVLD
jgi:hypothetical protein